MPQSVTTSAAQTEIPSCPMSCQAGKSIRDAPGSICSDQGHAQRSTCFASGRTLDEQRRRIETVRVNNPIEQVIGRYVELRASGRRLVGCCPFHEDSSPSLVVYPDNGSWFCFACDVGGDVFAFLKRIEYVSFDEAWRRLDSGSLATPRALDKSNPVTTQSTPRTFADQKDQLELTEEHFTLLTAATEVYHAALLQQPKLLTYLARRGFNLDAVCKYRLGYAAGDNLEKYFRFRGWNQQAGLELGLQVKKRDGVVREYFNKRIVVPELRVCSGGPARTIYLVGRATEGWQKAKYLGLPNAPKPLWGAELARDADEVFVCEGVFDMLTLIEWGYAAVATLGHPKREHVEELARAERIYIATDADDAGREFAGALKEWLGNRAIVLPSFKRFKELQGIKDVNELMEKHPQDGRDIFARLVRYVETHQE